MRPHAGFLLLSLACVAGNVVPAQVLWSRLAPGSEPSARAAPAMVYDAARQRVVLFGGNDLTSASCCPLDDTWEWDGGNWTLRQPLSRPSSRSAAAAAYDSIRGRIVLFGGTDGATYFGDTWEWDGTDWARRVSAGRPAGRGLAAMAFDAARGETVLFGGFDGASYLNDIWSWDGNRWAQRTPGVSPAARDQCAFAYDQAAREIVMFGGATPSMQYDDTWAWDGTNWSQRFPAHTPGRLWAMSAAYMQSRGRLVLFGGYNGSIVGSTWEWTGVDWELRGPGSAPSPRFWSGFTYDAARDGIVLFGGLGAWGAGGAVGETWVYRAFAASHVAFGSGCAGSAGTPALAPDPAGGRQPWLGSTFALRLSNLPGGMLDTPLLVIGMSRTAWPPFSLPLALSPIGMTGCSLFVSLDLMVVLTNLGGFASAPVTIPNDNNLLGGKFFSQGFVLDRAANPFGMTATNAGESTIGLR